MSPRFLICIPVYNNDAVINRIVAECISQTTYQVLIVDDGSDAEVVNHIDESTKKSGRLNFIKHKINLGKGAALQTAFHYAVENNFTHVITINGDASYSIEDIKKLVNSSTANPLALVIGDREMRSTKKVSKNFIARTFASFMVKYETDAKVTDSQCGLRSYPLFFLQNMKFYSKKYDFEVEILIRLIWAGVQVENIKIGATYEAPSDKVSHKHKINDRLRLLLLNLSLITVSLLTERTSPAKSAFAFSIGVFVGVLPVFGFHAVIVSGIAVLFRLNFIYLWMGTHISTPIFIPFLIYASKKAGGYFFQHIYKNPVKATESFLVGSVLLGILMAAIFYVVVFYLKKKLNQKHKIWSADDRNQATTAVINFSISKIGLPWTYSLLKIVALFDYLFLFRVRAASNEYWRVSAYKLSFIQRQRKVFQNIHMFLKTKADTAYLNMKITNVFTFDMDAQTSELLENKKKDGQKLFLISSHAGVAGLNTPRLKAAFLNHEPIVIVSDRPTSENFEQILFFKKLAHFEASELRLALDKNFEVHFIFCFKTGLFKYKLFSERSVENASLSEAERLQDLLNQYVRLIEKHLRQYPDQWFNFFPFWSTPPESASPTTILQKAEPQP